MEHRFPKVRRSRLPRALAATAVMSAGMVVLLSAPAAAHVRVLSEGAEAGKPATLRFRVPSEKEFSTTVRVDIALPQGVTAGSVPPVKGWTTSRTSDRHIVWTARAGSEIQPADTRTFTVRANPLPKKPVLRFDTAQTYSDGSVVTWNQPSNGGPEPDFPSPELILDPAAVKRNPSPATETEERSHSTIDNQPKSAATPMARTTADGHDLPAAVWVLAGTLAGAGIVVLVLRRPRRRSAHSKREG